MLSNQKINPIVTELYIRGSKLNISLVFTIQHSFSVPKIIRRSSTHYFLMKVPKKQQAQQIAFNHSADIELEPL